MHNIPLAHVFQLGWFGVLLGARLTDNAVIVVVRARATEHSGTADALKLARSHKSNNVCCYQSRCSTPA